MVSNWSLESCPIAATSVRTRERRRSRAVHPPKHDPTEPTDHDPTDSEPSCTNLSEETLTTWRHCQCACAWPAKRAARARWDKEISGLPNPLLTRTTLGQCLMGLPVTASCDTAWARTQVCSGASGTVMQCLRPLHHSGGPRKLI